MRFARPLTLVLMLALAAAPVLAQTAPPTRQSGTLIYSDIPEIPETLRTDLQRYRNARSAGFQDWMEDGSMLISTRFQNTVRPSSEKTGPPFRVFGSVMATSPPSSPATKVWKFSAPPTSR